jgi:ABC-type molybdate transport system substrate-binding protein
MTAAASVIAADAPVRLFAAGSLRSAFTDLVTLFQEAGGGAVEALYGPSGSIRDRIAGGEPAELFASADMEKPRALTRMTGRSVVLFARNSLCALVQPDLGIGPDNLLDRLLAPDVRIGISTPKADPSGDYAVALFAKAGTLRASAAERLNAKAMRLTGGPAAPHPPAGRSPYGQIMARCQADVFLTYRTNAWQAVREVPGLQAVTIPEELSVGADYGLTVLNDRPQVFRLALFILSPEGQGILARHGFDAPLLPGAVGPGRAA